MVEKWGIDISGHQFDYDMKSAKEDGIEFIIIRGGTGQREGLDYYFEKNYKKAKDLGIPCGVYWFANAKNSAEMLAECERFYEGCVKGRKYELPIYIDVEEDMLKLDKRLLTNLIIQFCEYFENKGCFVGIYMSALPMMYKVYSEELKPYTWWIADWNPSCRLDCSIWQYGTTKTGGRNVDSDFMYEDFPSIIKDGGFNGYGSQFKIGDSAWINYKIEKIDGDTVTLTDGVNHIEVKEEFLRKGN